MRKLFEQVWSDQSGQDVAEYALMLAVILVLVIATIKSIGTEASTVFTNTSTALG